MSLTTKVHHAEFAEVFLAGWFLVAHAGFAEVFLAGWFFTSFPNVLFADFADVFLAGWFLVVHAGFAEVFFTGWFLVVHAGFPEVFFTGWFLVAGVFLFDSLMHEVKFISGFVQYPSSGYVLCPPLEFFQRLACGFPGCLPRGVFTGKNFLSLMENCPLVVGAGGLRLGGRRACTGSGV